MVSYSINVIVIAPEIIYNFFSIKALADEERKKLEEKEALEEKKREEAERKLNIKSFFITVLDLFINFRQSARRTRATGT